MNSAPEIQAVLFDYGQVLSAGPNPAAWERLRAVTGGSADLFHSAYWQSRHDYDRGALDGSSYWGKVASAAGHPGLNEADLEALYQADVDLWTDLNQPMVEWAGALHQRGVRTGVLSNIGDQMERGIRRRFDWIEHFDHCIWSHALRLAKPQLEIYEHAARGLGVKHSAILFLDDREENIVAARAVGMKALHYTSHDAFTQEMQDRGWSYLL